jgi:hypothetical protein
MTRSNWLAAGPRRRGPALRAAPMATTIVDVTVDPAGADDDLRVTRAVIKQAECWVCSREECTL